mmetsp:Transcript_18705/g.54070  ORF Transcript_18705/g.54070 Transcript_18705/m.54070 type:complete len:202 (-) Transcript_18705:1419-2024(-)
MRRASVLALRTRWISGRAQTRKLRRTSSRSSRSTVGPPGSSSRISAASTIRAATRPTHLGLARTVVVACAHAQIAFRTPSGGARWTSSGPATSPAWAAPPSKSNAPRACPRASPRLIRRWRRRRQIRPSRGLATSTSRIRRPAATLLGRGRTCASPRRKATMRVPVHGMPPAPRGRGTSSSSPMCREAWAPPTGTCSLRRL